MIVNQYSLFETLHDLNQWLIGNEREQNPDLKKSGVSVVPVFDGRGIVFVVEYCVVLAEKFGVEEE